MDVLIEKLLTNGGPLATLVVVVWIFVKDRHVSSQEHRTWMDGNLKTLQEMMRQLHSDHLDARREAKQTVDRNTDAMIANTGAMQSVAEAVNQCPMHK